LDKTIRVKDALRLFNACGFLRGLKRGDVPWADLSKQIFAFAAEEDLLVIDEQEREALIAAQESGSTTPSESDLGGRSLPGLQPSGGAMGGFGGFGAQSGGMGGFGGLGSRMDEGDEKRRKGDKLSDSRSRCRGKKDVEDDEKVSKDKDEHQEGDSTIKPQTAATLVDFAHCDFTITPLQALRLILEVASPGSVKALYWQLDPTRVTVNHETIALLEFAESELVFTEFVRLLVRMSDLGTRKDIPLCERLTAAVRFEGFVRHVFLPALRTPYVPPTSTDETEKGSDAARSNENGEEAPEEKEGSNPGEEEAADVGKDEDVDTVGLWSGFDDYSCAEVEAQNATRRWPSGYEHEIASWM